MLSNETVVFTSTKKSDEPFTLVRHFGGIPISLPLIQTNEISQATDRERLIEAKDYDWLIFTSQSAVSSFAAKLQRNHIYAKDFNVHVAAVGDKTAQALEAIGFRVDFIPDVFSADVFVKQFNPKGKSLRALFIRGNLAGRLISTELSLTVNNWTVYETLPERTSAARIVELAKSTESLTILFASPSAVAVFEEQVAPEIGWTGFTIGAIGHITERALEKVGAPVHVIPDTYTLPELVMSLARVKRKEMPDEQLEF